MNQVVYVETSIPSFYFDTRTSMEIQVRRQWTRDWRALAKWQDALVTSAVVESELEDTSDAEKKAMMFELLDDLPRLDYADEIDSIVEVLPENSCRSPVVVMLTTSRWPRFIVVICSRHGAASTSPTPTRPSTSAW